MEGYTFSRTSRDFLHITLPYSINQAPMLYALVAESLPQRAWKVAKSKIS